MELDNNLELGNAPPRSEDDQGSGTHRPPPPCAPSSPTTTSRFPAATTRNMQPHPAQRPAAVLDTYITPSLLKGRRGARALQLHAPTATRAPPRVCARAHQRQARTPKARGHVPLPARRTQLPGAGPSTGPGYHSLARSTICPRCACGCVPPGCGRAPGRARPWAGTFLLRCRLCVDSSTCATLASGKEAEIDIEKHGPGPG